MDDTWSQTALVGLVAVILLGGSVGLLLTDRPVPEWLAGLDGAMVTALVLHVRDVVHGAQTAPERQAPTPDRPVS